MNTEIPDNEFGFTRTEYNVGYMPPSLPQRDVLIAANELNRHRYEGLTTQQRRFVDSYFLYGCPTMAARAAWYSTDEKICRREGRRLMKTWHIAKAIEHMENYYTELSKYRWLSNRERHAQELDDIASSNFADFVGEDDYGRQCLKLPIADRKKMSAVSKMKFKEVTKGRGAKQETVHEVEITLHDKIAAKKELFRLFDTKTSADARGETPATNINLSDARPITFEIVAVPSGEFIPAPENPYLTIDHETADSVDA